MTEVMKNRQRHGDNVILHVCAVVRCKTLSQDERKHENTFTLCLPLPTIAYIAITMAE